ncbi:reverse transcriptase domain-containing protein, partial [Salmonella enterica]
MKQPPGFEEPSTPDYVYRLKKALYGLKQAPRAWYDRLSYFLMKNGFSRGKIDNTLFRKQLKDDYILVQLYVDDIIFGATSDK